MRASRFIPAAILVSVLLVSGCKPAQQSQNNEVSGMTDADMQQFIDDEMGITIEDAEVSSVAMMPDAANASAAAASKAAEMQAQTQGRYTAFSPSVIGNGQTAVLFFHAAWCPICRDADESLTALYGESGGELLTTYKVDYDASADLKKKYGVTYQHTFVKIDGQGNMIEKVQSPADDRLLTILMK